MVSKEQKEEVQKAIKAKKPVQFKMKGTTEWNDVKSMCIIDWNNFEYRLKPKDIVVKKVKKEGQEEAKAEV